ncbi:MAG: hypothetical protein K9L68_04100 [Spirochaetales bacterium]|nr:hypothetical protein [Spirochaetales bacterium]MCF7937760.1 hypothetical protein [Spirochaetales bacterium]
MGKRSMFRWVARQNINLLLADIPVIALSLFFAWIIRAQLHDFLYRIDLLMYMLPYVILIRLINNVLFEMYSFNLTSIRLRDIEAILFQNMVPSIILVLLRFFSPIPATRIPVIMIFSEYFITFAGMLFVRILFVHTADRRVRKKTGASLPSLSCLYLGSVRDYIEMEAQSVFEKTNLSCKGIILDDIYDYQVDVGGNARVLGTVESTYSILFEQNAPILCVGRTISPKAVEVLRELYHNRQRVLYIRDNDGLFRFLRYTDLYLSDSAGSLDNVEERSKSAETPPSSAIHCRMIGLGGLQEFTRITRFHNINIIWEKGDADSSMVFDARFLESGSLDAESVFQCLENLKIKGKPRFVFLPLSLFSRVSVSAWNSNIIRLCNENTNLHLVFLPALPRAESEDLLVRSLEMKNKPILVDNRRHFVVVFLSFLFDYLERESLSGIPQILRYHSRYAQCWEAAHGIVQPLKKTECFDLKDWKPTVRSDILTLKEFESQKG